jgi:TetR/AcrR family transcriptional repressor of nem operon
VAEITRAAGLTHGGFYGQFASKGALAEEACEQSFAESLDRLQARLGGPEGGLDQLLESYLSQRHRDRPDDGCPMAAYASEIPRQPTALQDRFAVGVARYVDTLAEGLPDTGGGAEDVRRRALTILAALVGAMVLARATAQSDPKLSAELLASLRSDLGELAGRMDG